MEHYYYTYRKDSRDPRFFDWSEPVPDKNTVEATPQFKRRISTNPTYRKDLLRQYFRHGKQSYAVSTSAKGRDYWKKLPYGESNQPDGYFMFTIKRPFDKKAEDLFVEDSERMFLKEKRLKARLRAQHAAVANEKKILQERSDYLDMQTSYNLPRKLGDRYTKRTRAPIPPVPNTAALLRARQRTEFAAAKVKHSIPRPFRRDEWRHDLAVKRAQDKRKSEIARKRHNRPMTRDESKLIGKGMYKQHGESVGRSTSPMKKYESTHATPTKASKRSTTATRNDWKDAGSSNRPSWATLDHLRSRPSYQLQYDEDREKFRNVLLRKHRDDHSEVVDAINDAGYDEKPINPKNVVSFRYPADRYYYDDHEMSYEAYMDAHPHLQT